MKPLATYYKLVDRDTEKIGAKWKGKKLWKTQVHLYSFTYLNLPKYHRRRNQ